MVRGIGDNIVDPINVIAWGIACLVWLFFGSAVVFIASYLRALVMQHRDEQRSIINSDVQEHRNETPKCVLHLEILSACRECVTDIKEEARSDERNEIIEEINRPDRWQLLSGKADMVNLIKARGELNG